MIRKAIKLVLVILLMGIIFSFSSDNGTASTKKSDGVIVRCAEFFMRRQLTEKERKEFVNILVVPVRKGAHFTVYLILGLLVFSYIKEFGIVQYKAILLSIGICFLYACSDEIHQLFVSGRSGKILDVIIDTLGASIGTFIYLGISKLLNKEKNYE